MSDDLQRARELLRVRRPQPACEAVLRHLAAEPDDAYGHALLALTRLELDDVDGAAEAAQQAVVLCPDDAYVNFVHGTVSLHEEDLPAALQAANAALQCDPDHAASHELLSRVQFARGDRAAARAAIEAALRLDPDDSNHHMVHAFVLRDGGDRAGALTAVGAGLRLAPEDPDLHNLHGELLLQRGAPGPAGEAFLTALRSDPDNEAARRGLLEALRAGHPAYRPALRLRTGALQLARRGGVRLLMICYVLFLVAAILIGGRYVMHGARAALIGVLVLPTELGNAFLLLHPFGRHVLQLREKVFAVAIFALLALAIALGATSWLTDTPSLRRHALATGGAALFGGMLHVAIDHSQMRRTTWVLIGVMAVLLAVVVLVGIFG